MNIFECVTLRKVLNCLTFTPLSIYGFACGQIFCNLSLQCQVVPERLQLTQDESRQIRHIWYIQELTSTLVRLKIREAWTGIKLTYTKPANISLPALIQLVCGPARDLQKGKCLESENICLIDMSSECFRFYVSPKGSFFSAGTKLFCSNIARILPSVSVSSLGSKISFPAQAKWIKNAI